MKKLLHLISLVLIIGVLLVSCEFTSNSPEDEIMEAKNATFTTQGKGGEVILFEDFEDSSGFTIGGSYEPYWGIAPLGGTGSVPSQFVQGGGQSGNIFYSSSETDSRRTMTINLPTLTGYTNLQMTVALAASEETWGHLYRDSLYITRETGSIDNFLPTAVIHGYLRSQIHSTDLLLQFQDFVYTIDSSMVSLTFTFACSTHDDYPYYPGIIGIDSVRITGDLLFEPVVVDLIAGQHIDVGEINIWNDEDNLYIDFHTTGDWFMTETHLAVSILVDDIPQKKGNPIPGHFPYKTEYEPPIQNESYVIPIEGEWFKSGVCIAVHAAVQQIVDENIMQEESAWGTGIDFPGKNWATYFTYTLELPSQEPLTVTRSVPADGDVDVSVYTKLEVYFSADLDWNTITNDSIFLTDSTGDIVPGNVHTTERAVGLSTATLLATNTTYTIHATTAVQDVGGNPLESEFTSTFTTALP